MNFQNQQFQQEEQENYEQEYEHQQQDQCENKEIQYSEQNQNNSVFQEQYLNQNDQQIMSKSKQHQLQDYFQNQNYQHINNQAEYKVSSPDRTSKQVLQRVLDGDLSGQQSPYNQNIDAGQNLNQIAVNLSKININESQSLYKNKNQSPNKSINTQQFNQNYSQENQNYSNADTNSQQNLENQDQGQTNLEYQEDQNQDYEQSNKVDVKFFDICYKDFLQKIAADQKFVGSSYEEKIAILIDYFSSDNYDYRLGALIFLFELIYNFRESLTDHAITLILSQIYISIPSYYESKDFYNVFCALEIIALIGPHVISFNNIKLLASILIDEAIPALQEKAFLALFCLDYPGFYALLDIANKDFQNVPDFILNKLAQTEEIQLSVIIPSLLNDINTGEPKKKVQSLAAMNRMFSLVYKAGGLPLLIQLLQEGSIDRQLIVSTIRACGDVGEQALIKIAKMTQNQKIKLAISTVLSWRVGAQQKSQLDIKIIPYQVAIHYNVNPGTMCVYEGSLTPLAFENQEKNYNHYNSETDTQKSYISYSSQNDKKDQDSQSKQGDFISINSRDFIAALQRLLSVKYDKFQELQAKNQLIENHDVQNQGLLDQFTLAKLIDPNLKKEQIENEKNDANQYKISNNVIKILQKLIYDQSLVVRESSLNAIGIIGLPEAKSAIETLQMTLYDKEAQIRAMGAWCCGRLEENVNLKICKRLIELLKDNYWKVRTASCVAIGAIGSKIADMAYTPLAKILKDNTINKLTVCETLVRLGIYGEQILIDILKQCPQTNFKLKSAIIQAFQLANVQKPTIDFIIEELFKNANDSMIQVRKACLNTLEILRNRSQDSNITYLKSKNILPLFYYFLQDQSSEIREMAMYSIRSFGPQAELIFIEGLTKDKNPIIRCECAKGLASLGVQNFRALLFGLRDIDENVRKITSNCIKNFYSVEEVVIEYQDKENQVPALLINIKDILSLPFMMNEQTREILEEVLIQFGEDITQIQQLKQQNYFENQPYNQQSNYEERKSPQKRLQQQQKQNYKHFQKNQNNNKSIIKQNIIQDSQKINNENIKQIQQYDRRYQIDKQLPKFQYVQYEPKNSSFMQQEAKSQNSLYQNQYELDQNEHQQSQEIFDKIQDNQDKQSNNIPIQNQNIDNLYL